MCVFEFSEKYNDIKCDDCPATDVCNSNGAIVDEIKKLVANCIKYENSLKVQKENYVKDFAECLRVDCYQNGNIEFIDDIDYVLEKFLAGEYEQQLKEMKNKLEKI